MEDRIWIQATVMDALKALPKINSLRIWIDHCWLQAPFHFISELKEISIDSTNREYYTGTTENLAKTVVHSPQLNSINMKSVHMFRIPFGKMRVFINCLSTITKTHRLSASTALSWILVHFVLTLLQYPM